MTPRERTPTEQAILRAALSVLGNHQHLQWKNVLWQLFGILEVANKLYKHGFRNQEIFDEVFELHRVAMALDNEGGAA